MNPKITSLLSNCKQLISLEVSPTKTLNLEMLLKCPFDFVAVTWIGNFDVDTADLSLIPPIELARKLVFNGINVLLHLPGRNLNKKTAIKILEYLKDIGVKNILALKGQSSFIREKDDSKVDFPYASHFVEFIKEEYKDYFDIGVTGYPETHPNSVAVEEDMKFLKLKVSKGCDFIVTQASFDISSYKKFSENCLLHNIELPIFVGTAVLTSYDQILMLKKFCKISVNNVMEDLENIGKEAEDIKNLGETRILAIGEKVFEERIFKGLHIFSMNDLELTLKFYEGLSRLPGFPKSSFIKLNK